MKFYNISNHPSSAWEEKQIASARNLVADTDGEEYFVPGKIVDIPFPSVDPEWSVREIKEAARKILQHFPQRYPDDGQGHGGRHAIMVMGEFTLSYMLIEELLKRGWRVYAATTHLWKHRIKGKGSTFANFRQYSTLSSRDLN